MTQWETCRIQTGASHEDGKTHSSHSTDHFQISKISKTEGGGLHKLHAAPVLSMNIRPAVSTRLTCSVSNIDSADSLCFLGAQSMDSSRLSQPLGLFPTSSLSFAMLYLVSNGGKPQDLALEHNSFLLSIHFCRNLKHLLIKYPSHAEMSSFALTA